MKRKSLLVWYVQLYDIVYDFFFLVYNCIFFSFHFFFFECAWLVLFVIPKSRNKKQNNRKPKPKQKQTMRDKVFEVINNTIINSFAKIARETSEQAVEDGSQLVDVIEQEISRSAATSGANLSSRVEQSRISVFTRQVTLPGMFWKFFFS